MRLTLIAGFLSLAAAVDPDVSKSFEEICEENGFASENYTLTTTDGYILSMYRIPGTISDDAQSKPPVLMVHC